jgi:signal transduction histidine kinase
VLLRGTRPAVTVAAVHAVAAFVNAWTVLQQPAGPAFGTVGVEALWLTAAIAVTVSYCNWRRWQAESLQRLRTELDEQRGAERLRLAREVHDAVAHTLAVVGVQVSVAADALDDTQLDDTQLDENLREARTALRTAQEVRRRAMADLGALVGVLRSSDQPSRPPALEDLVEVVRGAGLDATLTVTGDEESVPLPVRLVAAAVVREALTNVVRHANAAAVAVEVHYGPSTEVTVTDDGTGGGAAGFGHGLRGLSERVAALGGTLRAQAADGRGFAVHATMPQ